MTGNNDKSSPDPVSTSIPRPGTLKKYADYSQTSQCSENILASSNWLEMDWSQGEEWAVGKPVCIF